MKGVAFFDISNMCYRAFYGNKWDMNPDKVNVVSGFFLTLCEFYKKSGYRNWSPIFCFDEKPYLRSKIFPGYKKKEPEKDPVKIEALRRMFEGMDILRHSVLPYLWPGRVWSAKGYECDDLMAFGSDYAPGDSKPILVTSDEDLYQLLDWVYVYNLGKKKIVNKAMFIAEKGIQPALWSYVKALAGCKSDHIPGIEGIGETFAIQYINATLKGKRFEKCEEAVKAGEVEKWHSLTKLPFKGVEDAGIDLSSMETPFNVDIEKLYDVHFTHSLSSSIKFENFSSIIS